MTAATQTNYIISAVPESAVEEFVSFMQVFRKKTGCTFRFKADGRTAQPVSDFPQDS